MPGGGELRAQLLLEARDANLEELVEIVADDAQEAQPLEQRNGGVLRQREHAPVECELRQLAIDRRRTVMDSSTAAAASRRPARELGSLWPLR